MADFHKVNFEGKSANRLRRNLLNSCENNVQMVYLLDHMQHSTLYSFCMVTCDKNPG